MKGDPGKYRQHDKYTDKFDGIFRKKKDKALDSICPNCGNTGGNYLVKRERSTMLDIFVMCCAECHDWYEVYQETPLTTSGE